MADVTTLPELFWPLMDAESVKLDRCAICGRRAPLNDHHIVWRSQGQLVRDGVVVPKPTITLCGEGNNLYGTGPDGERVTYCHGKVHHRYIHFRNDRGRLQYAEFDVPLGYEDSLEADCWLDVCVPGRPFARDAPLPAGGAPAIRLGWERTSGGGVLSGEEAMRRLREMFGIPDGGRA